MCVAGQPSWAMRRSTNSQLANSSKLHQQRSGTTSGSLGDKSDVGGVRLAARQSQTQAGRRSGERGLCAAAQINEILCSQRVEAMLRARVRYSTLRSANHQNGQEHDSPDTEQPNSSQSWAAVIRAEERFDANRSSAFKPRRRFCQ